MSQLMIEMESDGVKAFLIYCPGCKCYHKFSTDRWTWNGSHDAPTFSPSMLVMFDSLGKRCHSFVRNGQWQFLGDCSHELAGQTVPLVPEDETPDISPFKRHPDGP